MSQLQRRSSGTGWPRSRPAGAVRNAVQIGLLRPLVLAELTVDARGRERLSGELAAVSSPAVIVANHASHLDAAVLLSTLPSAWRRRTAVATATDSFAERWRNTATALVFNTFPTERGAGVGVDGVAARLLEDGWNVLVFPEETRSPDGFPRPFHPSAAALAIAQQVPVVPVGLRGTYAAMPRGHRWPVRGRPRVSVRYGRPLEAEPGESAEELSARLAAAVHRLVAEDATSWWSVQREVVPTADDPPVATWRRIWEQSEAPTAGGQPQRAKIWRQ